MTKEESLKELRTIPGIGKACSYDLWNIGIRQVSDLKNKNPMQLYQKLNAVTGVTHDPCMLYTFRCAVYYASAKDPTPEKLKWWYWKDRTFKEK
jgi:Pathogenicity locus